MRACTAAGINIPLLPRDATAMDLPMGICWWCRPGKGFFFLGIRVDSPMVPCGEEASFP